MLILVGAIKGGVGKTTIAVNLATLLNARFIDCDPQRSAMDWALTRKAQAPNILGVSTADELLRIAKQFAEFADVVIDCGGREDKVLRAALTIADVLVVPFRASAFDLWSLEQMGVLCTEAKEVNPKLRACSLLIEDRRYPGDTQNALEAASSIKGLELLGLLISIRKSYRDSIAVGLTVAEWRNSQRKKDHVAIDEMNMLKELTRDSKDAA